jgi:hypothetical protein
VRWTQRGVRGHLLRSHLVGGQRYVDRADYLEFIAAINGKDEGTPTSTQQGDSRLRRVEEQLDQAGI